MSAAPEFAPEVTIPVSRGAAGRRTAPASGVRTSTAIRSARTDHAARAALLATSPVLRRVRPTAAAASEMPADRVASTAWTSPRLVAHVALSREAGAAVAVVPDASLRPDPASQALSVPQTLSLAAGLRATSRPSPRLTRRGARLLAALVVLSSLALVLAAWLSSPSSSAAATPPNAPAVVTVHQGDTLWSLATRLAPDRDPRDVVSDLRRLNDLDTVSLQPGQQLHTR